MKCEICNKDILDNSQYINGKYYHNDCIEQIQQENARLKDKIDKAVEHIKNIDKYEETLNDDTRVYMIQDVDVEEIERILKEN